MNIDWSKAPEGATHYAEVASGRVCWYMVKSESEYAYAYAYQDEDFSCGRWTNGGRVPRHQPLIEHPKKQEAWNGEGLPPVGTVCDMHIDDFGWITGTVVVHIDLDEPTAVAHNGEEVFHGNASDFRQIKTAEQLAEEEKKKVIDDMQRIYEESMLDYSSRLGHASRPAIKALYEAGYRKQ